MSMGSVLPVENLLEMSLADCKSDRGVLSFIFISSFWMRYTDI